MCFCTCVFFVFAQPQSSLKTTILNNIERENTFVFVCVFVFVFALVFAEPQSSLQTTVFNILRGQTQGMKDEQGVAVELHTLWEVSCCRLVLSTGGLVLSTVSNFRRCQSIGILCMCTTIQDVLNEDQPCWNPPPCQHLLLCRP